MPIWYDHKLYKTTIIYQNKNKNILIWAIENSISMYSEESFGIRIWPVENDNNDCHTY